MINKQQGFPVKYHSAWYWYAVFNYLSLMLHLSLWNQKGNLLLNETRMAHC